MSLQKTWKAYQKSKISELRLADQIDLFACASLEYVEQRYSMLMSGPAKIFWLMIFTAILESKTHPSADINSAADIVRARHPRDAIKLYELKDARWKDAIDCRNELELKWRYFQETFKFKPDVPLADQIEGFNGAVLNFVDKDYPALTSPFTRYWMVLFTTITESCTHPDHEVITAFRALEQRYAADKQA